MVTEIQYTNIRRVLDDLSDHPLLRDITLEQVVRHTIRFISLHGYPKLYQDKVATVEIKDFRGLLPCDLVSIIQVRDAKSGVCMRSMTDTFIPGERSKTPCDINGKRDGHSRTMRDINGKFMGNDIIGEHSFKTQGKIIFTSFPEGEVELAYKSIPVDEDGFPLLIDNETYLNALEAYIKVRVFTVKFDTGKISGQILSNAQTEYAFAAHLVQQEFIMPSISEMESISRMWNTMIKPTTHFDNGFRNLGDREYRRNN